MKNLATIMILGKLRERWVSWFFSYNDELFGGLTGFRKKGLKGLEAEECVLKSSCQVVFCKGAIWQASLIMLAALP